ncbi:FecR family protein [Roseateles chitinivorans]|uniref:FecR family protein n=1 Tax=Roseateles chitinivorans TaxID=2917965 RepID=UPI003D67A3A9
MNGSVPPRGERAGRAGADLRTGSDSGWPSSGSAAPTPEVAAEAAVWIARLHGPDRSVAMERDCLAWQSRSDMHRLAFERCTEVWEAVPGLSLADAYSAASRARSEAELRGLADEQYLDQDGSQVRLGARGRWAWGGMALGVFALGALSVFAVINAGGDTPHYATGVGEQRSVVLADGSRLSLNTSTQVDVFLTHERRTVRIVRGEAFFEVAKDANRPFVVQALGSEVVALGTAFAVRLSEPGASARGLAVTLIEGRVNVRAGKASSEEAAVAPPKELTLVPGERVRLVKGARRRWARGLSDRPPAFRPSAGPPW